MDSYQLSVFCTMEVQSIVNCFGAFLHTDSQGFNNDLHVVLPILKHCIVLNFRRCSETTEDSVLSVMDLTLAVVLNNSERLTVESTWTGFACRKIEDQGVFAKFGIALGKVQHGWKVPMDILWGRIDHQTRPNGHLSDCHSKQTVVSVFLGAFTENFAELLCGAGVT